MKKLRHFSTLVLVLCLFISGMVIPAAAADKEEKLQITRFADGSYIITTIEYD